ncbi:VWA domain-containing protein [bacterium]|nr:VWA domain-containing protein [bacterium]
MKKLPLLLGFLVLSSCCAFGAKYTVNTSGVVKSPARTVQTSPANVTNQNYFNNYSVSTYVDQNIVNDEQAPIVEIVMDYSGSMANWILVAKRSMSTIVSQIPSSTKLGFRVFGHDNYGNNPSLGAQLQEVKKIIKKGNKMKVVTQASPIGSSTGVCSATKQVTQIRSANANSIINGMNSVDVGGATPLVYALDRAVYQDFASMDASTPKKIVLITDGGENCGGDPCEFARRLMAKRNDVHIDVVLVSSYSKSLTCLSSTTGGHFYNINNLSDFSTTINRSIKSKPNEVVNTGTDYQNNGQGYEFINIDE